MAFISRAKRLTKWRASSTASPARSDEARDLHHDFRQPIIEVVAEPAVGDHRVEVLVGRADDASVDRDRGAAADPLDHPLLKEAQQLDLERQRDVADLIEEQGAALRQLDLARRRLDRPGKSAALISEQLGLKQVLRNCRAIDGDELARCRATISREPRGRATPCRYRWRRAA